MGRSSQTAPEIQGSPDSKRKFELLVHIGALLDPNPDPKGTPNNPIPFPIPGSLEEILGRFEGTIFQIVQGRKSIAIQLPSIPANYPNNVRILELDRYCYGPMSEARVGSWIIIERETTTTGWAGRLRDLLIVR